MVAILQWLNTLEQKYGSGTAFRYVEEDEVRSVDYVSYVADVKKFASYLLGSLGGNEGVHIGILARNSYRYAVALWGILLAKGVAVPLNFEETKEIIQYEIEHADIQYLFTDGEYEIREPGALGFMEREQRVRRLEEYLSWETSCEFADEYDADCPAMMLFTSGTTGKSKAAMFSQRTLFAPIQGFENAIPVSEMGHGNFCMVPMYHISGIGSVLLNNSSGIPMNLCCNLKYMYRDLSLMKSTYTLVVPMVLKAWAKEVKRGHVEKLGGLKVIICGAAAADEEALRAFEEYGIAVFHAYALTEITGGGTMNASGNPKKIKSVGKPMQGCELKIENGEVCLKSEAVFCGYYKDPEETANTIRNGWLHTGDLGYLDEEGYLYLTGRKKNMIILSSGENVSPEELEELIAGTPWVDEVLVEGVGDKICAKIWCQASRREQIQDDITEMNRGLAFYKRVTKVEFVNKPLPKTATGKIQRNTKER